MYSNVHHCKIIGSRKLRDEYNTMPVTKTWLKELNATNNWSLGPLECSVQKDNHIIVVSKLVSSVRD